MIQMIMKLFGLEPHYCEVYDRRTGDKVRHFYKYFITENCQSSSEPSKV